MGSYDPIVIAICGAVSLLALVILLTAARIRRSEEDRGGCAPEPEPVREPAEAERFDAAFAVLVAEYGEQATAIVREAAHWRGVPRENR